MSENGIVDVTYGGQDYRLVKLAPKEAGRMALRIGKILSAIAQDEKTVETLIKRAQEAGAKAAITDMLGSSDLLAALAGGVANLDADALYDIGLECVSGRLFAGSKLHDDAAFNKHFAEHPKNMLPIMAWAIKENCGGFFGFGAKD